MAAIATVAALAVVGAASGAMAASARNRSLASSARSAARAGAFDSKRLDQQSQIERLKLLNEANKIRARVAVATAASGLGFGSTYDALIQQADYDEALNANIIASNRKAGLDAIESKTAAQIHEFGSQMVSPIMAAFTSGLQGAMTGLQISGGVKELGAASAGSSSTTAGFSINPNAVSESSIGDIGGAGASAVPSYGGSRFT